MRDVLISTMECVPGPVGNVTGLLCNNYEHITTAEDSLWYIVVCVLAVTVIYVALKYKPVKQELPRWHV